MRSAPQPPIAERFRPASSSYGPSAGGRASHETHDQWRRPPSGRAARHAPPMGLAGHGPPHRYQIRLRRGAMRRLHRAHRRSAAALLCDAGLRSRGQGDHHDRRPVTRWPPRGATRLGRAGRRPVRLLPIRTNHVGRGSARGETRPHRRRHRRRDDWEHLPLRNLPAHPRRRTPRRSVGEGRGLMNAARPPSRREFLKTGALVSGGLVIAFVVPGTGRFAVAQALRVGRPFAPNAFLRVGSDDSVTVLLAHSEMGQGIWTALPMLISEELDADWSKIKVEHAEAAPVYAHTVFGMQMTGGSTSTWSEFDRYRQAGALARTMLVRAAAANWKTDAKKLRTENGFVLRGKEKLSYGELAVAAQGQTPPQSFKLKDRKDWKILGKPTRRLDSPEKVIGKAGFGIDVRFPGLRTALVARSPVFGGTVKSFDPA